MDLWARVAVVALAAVSAVLGWGYVDLRDQDPPPPPPEVDLGPLQARITSTADDLADLTDFVAGLGLDVGTLQQETRVTAPPATISPNLALRLEALERDVRAIETCLERIEYRMENPNGLAVRSC